MGGRIFYLAHDVPFPSGGVNVMYQHVRLLDSLGYRAFVVHRDAAFAYRFAPCEAPVTTLGGVELDATDWLVVPEDDRSSIRSAPRVPCRKALFCQGHFNLVHGLDAGAHWRDFGFADFVCVSSETQRHLREWFAVDAHVVPPCIAPIELAPVRRGPIQVAYLPRKGGESLRLLRLLLSISPRYQALASAVEWTPIDRVAPAEAARRLAESDVLLATGHWEGLGLPPLEAMATGCIPVGYPAGGGRDYASDGNGVWVSDDEPYALATALVEILALLVADREHPRLRALRSRGRETAWRYSSAATEAALKDFWASRIDKRMNRANGAPEASTD